MSEAHEREDYESLVKAPGWRRLVQHFRDQYDAGVLEQRLAGVRRDGGEASMKVIVDWLCEKHGVLAVLAYPENRVRQLRAAEEARR